MAETDRRVRSMQLLLLALVLAAAAFLRWYRFASFPPGMWYDEAYTLLEGQRLAQGGAFRLYYPGKHGEPAVFWLTALALRLGAGAAAPRWVAGLAGLAGIPLLFFAVRDVLDRETPHAGWIALGAAAVLATDFSHLLNSRMGWEVTLTVLPYIGGVWLFWRALRDGRRRDWLAAGLVAGLGQYTGVMARLLPLALLLTLLGWWAGEGRRQPGWWKGLLLAGAAALLAYAPLLVTFLTHPQWFARRLQAAAPLSDVLGNAGRTLAGWLWMEDAALHRLPGRAIYHPAPACLFVVGLAAAVVRARRPAYSVWLAWFLAVLPAGALADPAPVYYRVLTAAPAAAALCALGGWQLWRLAAPRGRAVQALVLVGLAAVLGVSGWTTYRDYFSRWSAWPQLPLVMDVGKWRAAESILEAPAGERVLVTMPEGVEPAIAYAREVRQAGAPVRSFDGRRCLVYPQALDTPARFVVIWGYEHRSLSGLEALFPHGEAAVDPVFGEGEPYFVTFSVPAGGQVGIPGRLPEPVRYDGVDLVGAHTSPAQVPAGGAISVTLTWGAGEPPAESYTAFVHLLADDPAAGSPLRAQHDGIPCEGSEPTTNWQAGEYVVDEHVLPVPADLPAGRYLVGVGLYETDTQVPLLPRAGDVPVRWNEAIVTTVEVTAP